MLLVLFLQASVDTEEKAPFSSIANSIHLVLLFEAKQRLLSRGYPQLEEVAEKMSEEVSLLLMKLCCKGFRTFVETLPCLLVDKGNF